MGLLRVIARAAQLNPGGMAKILAQDAKSWEQNSSPKLRSPGGTVGNSMRKISRFFQRWKF
jgi:hypothetical protein